MAPFGNFGAIPTLPSFPPSEIEVVMSFTVKSAANDDTQVVEGKVTNGEGVSSFTAGPIRMGADGTARAEVVFDQPLNIPLSALIPDDKEREDFNSTITAILTSDSGRYDDIFAVAGMDPASDLIGSDFSGSEFVGTAERPLDMRGWNLSHCVLSNSVFEHVIVDETTNLTNVEIEGISGPDAERIAELVGLGTPAPGR